MLIFAIELFETTAKRSNPKQSARFYTVTLSRPPHWEKFVF
jgi:hypothetical protein